MSRFILTVFIFLLSYPVYSQSPTGYIQPFDVRRYSVLDTAKYRVDYEVFCTVDRAKKLVVKNDMCLLIGKHVSKFLNTYTIDNQKDISDFYERNFGYCRIEEGRGMPGIEIYKYLVKQEVEATVRAFPIFYKYTINYKDVLHSFRWSMSHESKSILGYRCLRGTTYFRGRSYTAWFAETLPFNNGPWLFGGGPGLILEIYDDGKEFHFRAQRVYQPKDILSIVKYKATYKQMSRENANLFCKRLHTAIDQTCMAVFGRTFSFDQKNYPYNPIELE